MIHGEQWDCKCGWSNVFVRVHCRNCKGLAPREIIERTYGKEEVDKWYGKNKKEKAKKGQRHMKIEGENILI